MTRETLLKRIISVTEEVIDRVASTGSVDKTELKRRIQERLSSITCDKWQEEMVKQRIREIVKGEMSLGRKVIALEARLEDRGLVGASSGVLNAVLEVGIAWDYTLDLPLIPGSTLKGAFRSTTLQLCMRRPSNNDRLECLKAVTALSGWVENPRGSEIEEIASLLGLETTSVANVAKQFYGEGLVVFHDTHLYCNESRALLEPWVITPHYREARNEYEAVPTPVEHLVLAPGLRASFVIAVEPGALNYLSRLSKLAKGSSCVGRDCLVFLAQLVAATLASGVGARTSRGYSRFRVERVYVR